jgi:hypothetical protein
MVWTDPGSLSTASVARTHGGGNTPRAAPAFPVIPESALRATLGILARTAAPASPARDPNPMSGRCGIPRPLPACWRRL